MLYGDDVAHFELARTFAKRATVLGEPRAWSVAAAWDRALLGRGLPQRLARSSSARTAAGRSAKSTRA